MARVRVKGINQARKKLNHYATWFPDALGAALYQEASAIFTESQKQVPVDEGYLQGSGHVSPPMWQLSRIVVIISYGVFYALPVHEKKNQTFTKPGAKRKYLQDPFNAALSGIESRLAIRAERLYKQGVKMRVLKEIKGGGKQGTPPKTRRGKGRRS